MTENGHYFSELPDMVRSHQIAKYRWCAEMSRIAVAERVFLPFKTGRMNQGIILHEWLDKRPHSKAELELEAALDKYATERGWWDTLDSSEGKPAKARYFIREPESIGIKRIKAHPDNLRVFWSNHQRVVAIEEYKGTRSIDDMNNPYMKVQYEWQLRTYIYVLRPVLESLGYKLAESHPITYFNRERGFFLGTIEVPAINDADFEMQTAYVVSVWRGEIPPKLPHPFKCRTCPFVYKSRCQLRQAWLENRLVVSDAEQRVWKEPLSQASVEVEELEW